jgi:hypothetical protein
VKRKKELKLKKKQTRKKINKKKKKFEVSKKFPMGSDETDKEERGCK